MPLTRYFVFKSPSQKRYHFAAALFLFFFIKVGAGAELLTRLWQKKNRHRPAPQHFFGSGKDAEHCTVQMRRKKCLILYKNARKIFFVQDIEKSLSQSHSSFKCPAPEGHFPDPVKCDVYYQGGVLPKTYIYTVRKFN